MGSEEEPQRLKHMADHMIEEGLIEPMIFVMPTYVYSREELEQARATALTFYKELINDLIPAVEGQFRTYAADLTAEGIRRSRGASGFRRIFSGQCGGLGGLCPGHGYGQILSDSLRRLLGV